ncbi:MAG: YCF48-related protein [Pyrinomonadaceae bacterium]
MKPMNYLKKRHTLTGLCLALILSVSVFADEFVSSFDRWNNSGPTGGDVRTVVVDPKNKNHLFITTLDGQIYATYDSGSTWNLLVNLERPRLILDDLIVDPRDSNVIYASGHRHKLPGGFFKTTDGGKTWKESKQLRDEAIHAMVQSSLDPNLLIVGTVNGVWYSSDSGDSWNRYTSSTTPTKLDSLAIDPRDVNTIYAGTWWRAYKTTDGGKSWNLVKNGMIDDSDVFAIDINPQNPDHVIASACSGIYQSFNKGENWKKIQGIPSQSRRTRAIVQNPYKPGAVYAGTTEGFWLSENGGRTWALTTTRNLEINAIAVHQSDPNKVYIATNNEGVLVSTDGGKSFGPNNGNFSSRFTYNVTPDIERPNKFYATTINTATGGGFIFTSDDFGRTWRSSDQNLDTKRTIAYSMIQDTVDPNLMYLATNFGLYKSVNRGVSWTLIKAPAPPKPVRRRRGQKAPSTPKLPEGMVAALTEKINTIVRTNDGRNGYFAATNDGLYRSYDIEKGWQKIELGEGITDQVFSVHIPSKTPGTIWIGTAVSGVLVSRDNGLTWSRSGGEIIPDRVPISTVVTSPDDPNKIYVGSIQTFYMSENGGKTWTRRGGNLPIGNYNSILINPENPREIFVASALEANGGVFHSTDAGWTWERIDKGTNIASDRVWSLMFNPANPNEILAGTHSSGIYRIGRTLEAKVKPEVKEPVKPSTPETFTRTRVATSN